MKKIKIIILAVLLNFNVFAGVGDGSGTTPSSSDKRNPNLKCRVVVLKGVGDGSGTKPLTNTETNNDILIYQICEKVKN